MLTTSEFREALREIDIPSSYVEMLKAHYRAPGHIITATQLAASVGYRGHQAVNMHYGLLGKYLGVEMDYIPTEKHEDGSPIWTFVLATGERKGSDQEWEWQMRSELAKALEELGLV